MLHKFLSDPCATSKTTINTAMIQLMDLGICFYVYSIKLAKSVKYPIRHSYDFIRKFECDSRTHSNTAEVSKI